MNGRQTLRIGCWSVTILIMLAVLLVYSGGAFGIAYFLDSERKISTVLDGPDGKRTAQVESIVMGGAPLTVITVRRWWEPNTSLNLCRVAKYYANVPVHLRWRTADTVEIRTTAEASKTRIEERSCAGVHPIFTANKN